MRLNPTLAPDRAPLRRGGLMRAASRDILEPAGRLRRRLWPGIDQRSLYECLEQRVPAARRRCEFGMKLAADEPRMARQLDHLAQPVLCRYTTHLEAGILQPRQVMIVDLVTVAVAFDDARRAVDAIDRGIRL